MHNNYMHAYISTYMYVRAYIGLHVCVRTNIRACIMSYYFQGDAGPTGTIGLPGEDAEKVSKTEIPRELR